MMMAVLIGMLGITVAVFWINSVMVMVVLIMGKMV